MKLGDNNKMDVIEKVKQLITLMNDNDLAEIEIQEKVTKIRVKKSGTDIVHAVSPIPVSTDSNAALEGGNVRLLGSKEAADGLIEITAPMVGTFYRSSSPGSEPYIKVGDSVDPDTVACIIEAMKIMNEVKSGVTGVIVEILLKDGDPVEFSKPLFKVRPTN